VDGADDKDDEDEDEEGDDEDQEGELHPCTMQVGRTIQRRAAPMQVGSSVQWRARANVNLTWTCVDLRRASVDRTNGQGEGQGQARVVPDLHWRSESFATKPSQWVGRFTNSTLNDDDDDDDDVEGADDKDDEDEDEEGDDEDQEGELHPCK
jgi:hypothetical protein